MNKEQYQKTQDTILKVGKEIRFLNLSEFVEDIERAEGVAPMIDPTMYRAAMKNLQIIKKMAYGLMEFQNNLPEISSILDGLADAEKYNQDHA